MRKLVSILLLAVCMLAVPLQAYASDSVDLGDTPPMVENTGSGEQDNSPATSKPSAESSGNTTAISASGSNSPKTGDEHGAALWTGALLLATVGLTVTNAVRKRTRESV